MTRKALKGWTWISPPSNSSTRVLHMSAGLDRKSTRLNSSHANISYAVFCLKKKKHAHTSATGTHTYIGLWNESSCPSATHRCKNLSTRRLSLKRTERFTDLLPDYAIAHDQQ